MTTETWGNYEVDLKPIGKGFYSTVFQGFENNSHKRVAIKRLMNIQNAMREVELMKKCGKHPNIVEFYDFFCINHIAYIVMEYIAGGRLGFYKEGKKRDLNLSLKITITILKALDHLHQKGILHTDIQPHNILMIGDLPETLKIIDLGSAVEKQADGRYRGKSRGGTDGFMPPEQNRSTANNDDSSDVYSAACIFLYLITGKAPFKPLEALQSIQEKPLQKTLSKALSTDIMKRYRTANEFIKVLEDLLNTDSK